jgi:hypothetical protein
VAGCVHPVRNRRDSDGISRISARQLLERCFRNSSHLLGRYRVPRHKTTNAPTVSRTMFRYLRIAVSVVSSLCCVLVIVLWVRSYWLWDTVLVPLEVIEYVA